MRTIRYLCLALMLSLLAAPTAFSQALLLFDPPQESTPKIEPLELTSKYLLTDSIRLSTQAITYLNEHRTDFISALHFLADKPDYTESLYNNIGQSISNAYEAAALAIATTSILKAQSDGAAPSDNRLLPIQHLNDILLRETSEPTKPSYSIFAEGQVLDSLKKSDSERGFDGTGVLGIRKTTDERSYVGRITIASDDATLTTGYASSVLQRAGGGSLSSCSIDIITKKNKLPHKHYYITGAHYNWAHPDNADSTSSIIVLGAGAMCQFPLANTTIGNTSITAVAEFGLSARLLTGSDMSNDDIRESFLVEDAGRMFGGLEMGLQLQLGNVVGAFQYFHYGGTPISGLSRGAVIAAFSVQADILPEIAGS